MLKFCEKCGAYMKETRDGLVCSKCGHQLKTEIVDVVKIAPRPSSAGVVDVLDPTKLEYRKVAKVCLVVTIRRRFTVSDWFRASMRE